MNKPGDGRDAVNRFIDAVKEGEVPRLDDMRHVATALEAILNGNARPKDALGINQGRGRPRGRSAFKKLAAIHDVRYMRGEKKMLLEDALHAVADKYSVSPGTLRNWFENSDSKKLADKCDGPLAVHAAMQAGAKVMAGEIPAREFWARCAVLDHEDLDHPAMLIMCAGARFMQWQEDNPGESHYPVPEGDEPLFGPVIRAKHN